MSRADADARAHEMESRGVDMSWYWRARAKQRDEEPEELNPDDGASGGRCGYITMYFIEYHQESTIDCYAHIFTVKTANGEKHRLAQRRRTKKTGDSVYWCSACGRVFKTWEEIHGHLKFFTTP